MALALLFFLFQKLKHTVKAEIFAVHCTLIFADFAQNSASANSKTRENILFCNILYAHFGHVGVCPFVLMLMGNILESV